LFSFLFGECPLAKTTAAVTTKKKSSASAVSKAKGSSAKLPGKEFAKKSNAKTMAKAVAKSDAKTSPQTSTKSTGKSAKPAGKTKQTAVVQAKKTSKPSVKTETMRSWYDHPELYELGFLKETPKESEFLIDVFEKYVPFPVKRVLELGCGSGRLICDMAGRGFSMTGVDLNPMSLDYCKKKLKKERNKAELVVGDMTNFKFDEQFDAAVNAINTFRHLETEEAALAHLNCVAEHLKPGGVFVLSLHLLPKGGDLWGTERWGAKTEDMSVYYALTVVETSMKTRLEKLRISMLVKKKDESFRLSDHITLRIYTVEQLKSLLAKCKKLKLVGVHDFWYDIESKQKLNSDACDTILVLQRT
jgi:SAM-dependent methyltransferase